MAQIERTGIQVTSLLISREENTVYLNNMDFKLTPAAMETLAVLAESRLDDEVLSGVQIEAMISGRDISDCDEAAGATRIKRLRDALGNRWFWGSHDEWSEDERAEEQEGSAGDLHGRTLAWNPDSARSEIWGEACGNFSLQVKEGGWCSPWCGWC